MTQAVYADASNEIKVFVAFIVLRDHALSANQLDRLAAERVHDVRFFELFLFFE